MLNIMSHFSSARLIKMLAFSPKKYDILNLRQPDKGAFMFAFSIENKLSSDQKRMRKWILNGTALQTPIRIALYLIKFGSHCTIFSVEFLSCLWFEPIYFGRYLNWNVYFTILSNIRHFFFPNGQGLKKVVV